MVVNINGINKLFQDFGLRKKAAVTAEKKSEADILKISINLTVISDQRI